ncbi:MAG: DUF4258 domain-containing protein [Crocosphaera sp.]|nr:DUF4258 domain-containing protein [Crocosphaera sp.]MDJ0728475.1 DUF4258 domain-containing protein [Crocosphaera sp.]
MRFVLSKHAEEEIMKRKIPISILELILENPEEIIEEDELKVYQGTFTKNNDKIYLLRIYVNDLVEPKKIVTVYFTSKLNKYRRLNNGS